MKVLITGASGLLGANLVRALLAQGFAVRALIHSTTRALENLDVEFVRGDICKLGDVCDACQGVEMVFHTAGFISIRKDEWTSLTKLNINGLGNVIQACILSGVRRMIHFSSIEAIDRNQFTDAVYESFPLATDYKQSPYALSKALGEQLLQTAIGDGFDAVIISPTSVIGPFDYKMGKSSKALLDMCKGKLPVLVEGYADWVDARDVAEGAIQAALHAPAGEKFILSGHRVSIQEMAETLKHVYDIKVPKMYLPLDIVRLFLPLATLYFNLRGKEPLITDVSLSALEGNWSISHEKAKQMLGYTPRPFETSLGDVVKWFRDTGLLP